ncbi:hypothetical protein IGI04_029212 [Brassica rapa subsp. trilocularis]|uniref:Uncharacterized protein n=1 Tax=Brassica rapa subsp. trilocularis TaxID=1813537 RepID=A0ABQ7LPL6_BRACM|nr:hypothetical protein IGI04_029212 [Brassica rapa subsp. trilocularis]
MAATKMFLIKWYSTSTNLEVFQIWKTSGTTYLLVVWKSSGLLGSLLTKSSGLPGSRLDFQEVVWTSRKSSGLPGSRFSDLEDFWDDLLVSRLEVIWKSSGSRLDFLKVVWTFCKVVWKSSELPKSLLAKSSEHRGSRLDFLEVTTYNSVVHETTEMLQISKSIAKITSALTRRLPGKSSTARRLKGKSSTARRLPNSLAYIRLLQAHRITNGSHPPIIVSFYDSMNHKNLESKSWVFLAHCGEKVRDMLCLVHKNGKRRRMMRVRE